MNVFKALIIVICVICIAESLSLGEKECISDFLSAWPDLGSLVPPWTSNASSACDNPPFKGITCTEGPEKHVIGLQISGLPHEGTVPVSISKLEWLETLKLNGRLIGGIPPSVGNLTRLKVLRLVVPVMQQILPEDLGSLTNLVSLHLKFDTYAFPVGDWIGNFHLLQNITLSGSRGFAIAPFGGLLPPSFCNLNLLEHISFHQVGLQGFSQCLGRLNQLRHLSIVNSPSLILKVSDLTFRRPHLTFIEGENVSGELDLEGLVKLESLVLQRGISGTLPASLWSNTELRVLDLSWSAISGTLPGEIGNLKQLKQLLLPSTRISGTIPPEIGKLHELVTLDLHDCDMDGKIPTEIGNLTNLKELDISSNRFSGTVPASLGRLSKLTNLYFGNCALVGSIPEDLMEIENLSHIWGNDNRLTGTIPDIRAGRASEINIQFQNNQLTGTIPVEILRIATWVDLAQNLLSGTIPESVSYNNGLRYLNLADNRIEGSLVQFSPLLGNLMLSLTNNKICGSIPPIYRNTSFSSLYLANNQLEGSATNLLQNPSLSILYLRNNKLRGTIPDSISSSKFVELDISGNSFTGEIPSLPSTCQEFGASHNQLSGKIDHIFERSWRLRKLDLSNNLFDSTLPSRLLITNISVISLASNSFSGTIPSPAGYPITLVALDLSNNTLSGSVPKSEYPKLSRLKLAGNELSGSLSLSNLNLRVLQELDISNNNFSFDVSQFEWHSILSFISATNNKLVGKVSLQGMSSLRRCDLSHNELDEVPDFQSISNLFTYYDLNILSIKSNARIPPVDDLSRLLSETKLRNTDLESPSKNLTGVVCKVLNFQTNGNDVFNYDEWLFSYQQCTCDRDHYGKPPLDCFSCQSLDSSLSTGCGINTIVKKANYYIYQSSEPTRSPLKVEPCLSEEVSALDSSNCIELTIQFLDNFTLIGSARGSEQVFRVIPTQLELAIQCQLGSSGRLCSRCDCNNHARDGSCYYPGTGNLCSKCSRVFPPSQFVPLSLAILSIACAILSTIFYFILASKRSLKDTKWEYLSVGKRVVYRLIHLTTLGQITITVTFVQILVEVTRWDKYALQSWIKLANGESEGLGLVCFFPFLSNPTWILILRLLLPFIVAAFVCGSIAIAEFLHRLGAFIRLKSFNDPETETGEDETQFSSAPLISTTNETAKSKTGSVSYPAKALAISTSISIIRFFYFGTAMAAHEYLFKEVQIGSGEVFVQSKPWMKYSDAQNLRIISIPFILMFLIAFPLAFMIMSWKLRHKIGSPFVRLYFGTLFENYQNRVYWWEVVNTLKKLLIALVLRGIPKADSFLPLAVAFFLALFGTLTFIIRPWKIKIENYLEGIGSLLTILSLLTNWTQYLAHSNGAMISIFVLDVIFVIVCIVVIVRATIQNETQYEIDWKARFRSELDAGAHSYGPPLLTLNTEEF